jgi:hypothetical protein
MKARRLHDISVSIINFSLGSLRAGGGHANNFTPVIYNRLQNKRDLVTV